MDKDKEDSLTEEQKVCDHDWKHFGRTPYKGVYLSTCRKCGLQEEYEKDYS